MVTTLEIILAVLHLDPEEGGSACLEEVHEWINALLEAEDQVKFKEEVEAELAVAEDRLIKDKCLLDHQAFLELLKELLQELLFQALQDWAKHNLIGL